MKWIGRKVITEDDKEMYIVLFFLSQPNYCNLDHFCREKSFECYQSKVDCNSLALLFNPYPANVDKMVGSCQC